MAFHRTLCGVYLMKYVQEIIPDCVVLHTHEMSASQQHTVIRSLQSKKEQVCRGRACKSVPW